MKTKIISILIVCCVLLGLKLIAQSNGSTEYKNCTDCCNQGNCQNGQGAWTFAKGDKYSGQFKNGIQNGEGTYTFLGGEKYVGKFKDGKPHGQGSYTYSDGDKYQGEFKEGKKNGQGTYTFSNGETYVGEWKDGKKNGQGAYTYSGGDKYIGEWKDGKRNGLGTYTFAQGTIMSGQWENGKFITSNSPAKEEKKTKEWSAYQGYLNWNDAKVKCAGIGMRLPTRAEITAEYDAKLTESWKKDGTYYWTSEETSEDYAYYVFIDNGKVEYFTKDVARYVRCIRSNEKGRLILF